MIKAVIFDMDGVLADTQRFHNKVSSNILKKYGIKISPEEIEEFFAGIPDRVYYKKLFEEHNIKGFERAVDEKWKQMLSLEFDDVKTINGVVDFLKDLKVNKIRLAVASSSRKDFVYRVLSALNIKDFFDVIITGEDVSRGKPYPDIFLLAAEKLGVKVEECVVFEDSINGMTAAKRAKMFCVGVVRKMLNAEYPADVIISDFSELSFEKLRKIVNSYQEFQENF